MNRIEPPKPGDVAVIAIATLLLIPIIGIFSAALAGALATITLGIINQFIP